MKKFGLFALVLGLMTLSACGGSDDEATKDEKKEDEVADEQKDTLTTCSAENEKGGLTAVIHDMDGNVVKFEVTSTMKYSEDMAKEDAELSIAEGKESAPEGVIIDGEANDDSYTIVMEIDLTEISDENLKELEGSFPVENVKTGSAEDFVKGWEEMGLTCK